ncbi:MAG: twin-arginine translocase subunit TatB [Gammaproteobacteria bacterium]|nr:twin-arginine translocase subunit TatB [Gammaproteobacteria bacterium]
MFDIGFWEIMLISILAMVVIGPERLPGVARTVGHWFGKTRRFIEGVKGDIETEFDTTELKRLLHNQEVQLKELQSKVNDEAGNIRSGFSYNLDDDKSESTDNQEDDTEDDYLEFMDEDEEKDHEQIAAEKAQKENDKQQAAREARTFQNSAVAATSEQNNDDDLNSENQVAAETDKQNTKNDG